MRNLTQSESMVVSGSACDYQLVGLFAFNLLFIGYYYLYSQDISSFDDLRILPITATTVTNVSYLL